MTLLHVAVDVVGPVGWHRSRRAPRNSVDWDMLYELAPAFEALLSRPEVKVIVLASAINEYFSTGADLSAFKDVDGDRMKDWVRETHRLTRAAIAALDA